MGVHVPSVRSLFTFHPLLRLLPLTTTMAVLLACQTAPKASGPVVDLRPSTHPVERRAQQCVASAQTWRHEVREDDAKGRALVGLGTGVALGAGVAVASAVALPVAANAVSSQPHVQHPQQLQDVAIAGSALLGVAGTSMAAAGGGLALVGLSQLPDDDERVRADALSQLQMRTAAFLRRERPVLVDTPSLLRRSLIFADVVCSERPERKSHDAAVFLLDIGRWQDDLVHLEGDVHAVDTYGVGDLMMLPLPTPPVVDDGTLDEHDVDVDVDGIPLDVDVPAPGDDL